MLNSLYISNYLLIDEEEIQFSDGFAVITGETGSGKSILINALGLLSGNRNKGNIAKNSEKKIVFEATFINHGIPDNFFEKNELDYDDALIIRREILPSGRSRFFINDTPTTSSTVKEITETLIDIHSQHQNLILNNPEFQISILDTLAGNDELLKKYKHSYHQYITTKKELEKIKELQKSESKEKDYIEYRLKTLKEADLKEKEYEELEAKIKELSNFEEIKNVLSAQVYKFYDSEDAIISQISNAADELSRIENFLQETSGWKERFTSIEIELSDLLNEIAAKNEDLEFDPDEYNRLTERYNLLNSLMQKFSASSVDELMAEQQQLEIKLNEINNYDDEIATLEKKLGEITSRLEKLAKELTLKRTAIKTKAENEIKSIITELGIKNGTVKIEISPADRFTSNGKNKVTLFFSANKQTQPGPISEIASGGEISRLMLAIKSILARKKNTGTIIFDEIDTGVSGEIADKMANILKSMSKNMQIIAITHLPQIAAKGDAHLMVSKIDTDKETLTTVKQITGEERITEIAKMMSGQKITDAARENAKHLLKLS